MAAGAFYNGGWACQLGIVLDRHGSGIVPPDFGGHHHSAAAGAGFGFRARERIGSDEKTRESNCSDALAVVIRPACSISPGAAAR